MYEITNQLGRLPGKYALFCDKKKSDIPKFFLNHKQSGYWVVHNQLPRSFLKGYLITEVKVIFRIYVNPQLSYECLIAANKEATEPRVRIC